MAMAPCHPTTNLPQCLLLCSCYCYNSSWWWSCYYNSCRCHPTQWHQQPLELAMRNNCTSPLPFATLAITYIVPMKTTQKEREETKEERDGENGKKGREKRWKWRWRISFSLKWMFYFYFFHIVHFDILDVGPK